MAQTHLEGTVAEAEVIKEAATRVLSGEGLRSIARDWNKRRIKPVGGNSTKAEDSRADQRKGEGERDGWNRRPRMTRDEKLEPIREMKAQLMSGEKRSLDADTHRARSWKVRARCGRGGAGRRNASGRCRRSLLLLQDDRDGLAQMCWMRTG
jgi:hypothetical protein